MIYLDNAATTKPCSEAIKAHDYALENFFNASGIYSEAIKIQKLIGEARITLLAKINAKNHNIIFTSGATEANNLAVFQATKFRNKTILISSGEHPSVYNCAKNLESMGYCVKYIRLLSNGEIDLNHLKQLLNENDVSFVSVIHVNNETGAINNLFEISKIVKQKDPSILLHSDGVQALNKIEIDLDIYCVDLYTISAHKIGALKGTGALVYHESLNIKPMIHGGGQEFNIRSGTENVGGILAFAAAVKYDNNKNLEYVKTLRQAAITQIEKELTDFKIYGNGSPYILSVAFNKTKSEVILRKMNELGIIISSGSACSSRKNTARVHTEMGENKNFTDGLIRISFSAKNNETEIKTAITSLINVVKDLRNE